MTSGRSSRMRSGRGADALAAAGGDGTQAIVADVAAEHGLPYACIPAGTRNHFALDLGVDRDDVVGALDALVDGRERRVDLAEVNGSVFVNNVSLGIYARGRAAGGLPRGEAAHDRQDGPGHARPRRRAARPALDRPGRREHTVRRGDPRLQQPLPAARGRRRARVRGWTPASSASRCSIPGTASAASAPVLQWAAPAFEVHSADPVPAGLDGEAVTLDGPGAVHEPAGGAHRADRAAPSRAPRPRRTSQSRPRTRCADSLALAAGRED